MRVRGRVRVRVRVWGRVSLALESSAPYLVRVRVRVWGRVSLALKSSAPYLVRVMVRVRVRVRAVPGGALVGDGEAFAPLVAGGGVEGRQLLAQAEGVVTQLRAAAWLGLGLGLGVRGSARTCE